MTRCIYCKREAPTNREHVLPCAFGRFGDNLVLDCVCRTCNQGFGDTVDRILGRDSLAALRRFESGLKPHDEVDDIGYERLTIEWPYDDDWKGVLLRLRQDLASQRQVVDVLPQAWLAHPGGLSWEKYTLRELENPTRPVPRSDDHSRHGGRIYVPSAQAWEQVMQALAARGVSFTPVGVLPPPTVPPGDALVRITAVADLAIRRAVAKISFNYLAYRMGAAFVLGESFDAIRTFVRECAEPYRLVFADSDPILANDTAHWRQTDGHLVTINWTSEARHIVGQVSLFNEIRYRVSLARDYGGLYRPDLRGGVLFDVRHRRVVPLTRLAVRRVRSGRGKSW